MNIKIGQKKTYYTLEQIIENERGWLYYDAAIKAWKKISEYIVGPNILDIGCGSGIMMSLIQLFNPEFNVVGVEGDSNSEILWKKRNLNVKVCDINELPFNDGEFNTVFSSHVLEHLENPIFALNEMKRVTNNRLITVVPDGDVDNKNFGSKHIHHFNRKNILELHSSLNMNIVCNLPIFDFHMNQLVAVYEK